MHDKFDYIPLGGVKAFPPKVARPSSVQVITSPELQAVERVVLIGTAYNLGLIKEN
jgi:hypothetical protein